MLWTWKSDDLRDLEKNLARLEAAKPRSREAAKPRSREAAKPKDTKIALGLYLWDYTGIDEKKKADPTYKFGKPVPLDLMVHQCSLGLKCSKMAACFG